MLEETANSASYAGGDGQSVFPIPFPFIESSHIRASLRPAGGRASALAAGTDYTVTHTPDGYGELILLRDPLPDGSTLVITRLVPLTQEILFRDQNPDYPRAVEEAADKLTMIAQQLKSDLDRCVTTPEGMSIDDFAAALVGKDSLEARFAGLDARLQALKTQMDALLRARHPDPVGVEPPPCRNDAAPPESAAGERYFLTRSGVYHTEGCRYGGKGAGTWLSLAEIFGGGSSARPCARCRPSPTGAQSVSR